MNKFAEVIDHMSEPMKGAIDTASIGVAILAIVDYLPAMAAALSIVWGCLRIYNEWLDIQRKKKETNHGSD